MKLWITVALIALMTASAYPREAKALGQMTSKDLYEICKDDIEDIKGIACLYLIEGAVSGVIAGLKAGEGEMNITIPPGGGDFDEAMEAIMDYLTNNTEVIEETVGEAVGRALAEKWPTVPDEFDE